jgi:hypothetical protein
MSLRTDLKKIKAMIKPKQTLRVIFNETDITDEQGVVWVLFTV